MRSASSTTARRQSPDFRSSGTGRQLLRIRTVWTIPLIVASVVVAVMTVLYISSVANQLGHLRRALAANEREVDEGEAG